jgi:hypothetical protein
MGHGVEPSAQGSDPGKGVVALLGVELADPAPIL